MRKVAFYGKGGIGKSTTAANVSAAVAEQGQQVWQIGCDPKNDSTRLLLGRICPQTVLEQVRQGGALTAAQVVHSGFAGVRCVEAGGPEPGVGCAGRGIIVALEQLQQFAVMAADDFVLYDVLGDVVCGGFAVPIREGYAEEIYIVSSGELMSLYAANNIAKGIAKFAARGKVRLAGIIGNSRALPREKELLTAFGQRLNSRLAAFIPRDEVVHQAEIQRKTVIEWAPQSTQAAVYRTLAADILRHKSGNSPTPLSFDELEELTQTYGC